PLGEAGDDGAVIPVGSRDRGQLAARAWVGFQPDPVGAGREVAEVGSVASADLQHRPAKRAEDLALVPGVRRHVLPAPCMQAGIAAGQEAGSHLYVHRTSTVRSRYRLASPGIASTPNSVRSTRMLALAVNNSPVTFTWPTAKLTGLQNSRTVSVPQTVLPAGP